MEALATIGKRSELAQPQSDSVTLTTRSGRQLPAPQVHALGVMMAQTQARYPNQELPEGTPDMYLMEWTDIALRFGLKVFRDGLSRAIGDSDFFPDPRSIAEHCQAIARDQREREATRKYLAEMDELKAQCERERLEDEANGGRVKSETELRLEAMLAATRAREQKPYHGPPAVSMTPEEIRAQVAKERGK